MAKVKTAFTMLLVVSVLGVEACSNDDDDDSGATTTGSQEADTSSAGGGEPILIRTHLAPVNDRGESTGEVRSGSTLGDSAFCVGGKFTDAAGEPPLDESVMRTFRCPDGTLTITFDPGPGLEASGDWKVVKGLAGFEGLSGGGRMKGVLESKGGEGRETFTGTVSR